MGKGAPRVSVVMTTFQSERHVAEAVRSVLAQTMAEWELVVVDDGSTDRTAAIVQAFRDPRIRFLSIPRCGRIASLNHGFRQARAPFVANLDADDVCLPERLRLSAAALEANPDWGFVGAGVVPLIDDAGTEIARRVRPTAPADVRKALGAQMGIFHSSVTYRRSAWEEAGGFDESLPLLEDYDMWVRIAARHPVANLPEPLALKRRHAGQAFDERHWTREGYRTRARILRRYVRTVRRSPVALARSMAYSVMGPGMRLAWLRLTRRDSAELEARKRMGK